MRDYLTAIDASETIRSQKQATASGRKEQHKPIGARDASTDSRYEPLSSARSTMTGAKLIEKLEAQFSSGNESLTWTLRL